MSSAVRADLGSSLKAARSSAGMTQEELAERAGISARTVSDIERGLRNVVHQDTARRLAAAVGLDGEPARRFQALARGQTLPAAATPGGLPVMPTRLHGRTPELESIRATLRSGDVRLLTLTGPGGIGKTRLAVEAARGLETLYPDGVFFVSLGEVQNADLVAPELAKAVGAVESDPALQHLLMQHLSGMRALILLDTFEHLTAAAHLVYALLLGCPLTTFVVTSRSALRLRGEHELAVPPLESPAELTEEAPAAITRWPAPALFWERAHAVRPDLSLDRPAAEAVVSICRRLDGIPLAIELAAARVKHLPLAALAAQLDHGLELLSGGPLDLPLRQRAIRDTVAWSHDLLDAKGQVLLRRLAVFSGGWTLDDVEPVCGPTGDIGDALDGVSSLVDQSLVYLDVADADGRYDMLDVIREYGNRRLAEAGEQTEVARRHALHYLALAEQAEPNLMREQRARWLRTLDVERGNLRSGIAWAIAVSEAAVALRFIVALWRYWRHQGEFTEGRRWSDAALALPGPTPASLRAKALWAAGALAFPQGDHARLATLAAEARRLAPETGDRMDLRNALTIEGMTAMLQTRYADALGPFRDAVDVCRDLGLTWQLGTSYLNLGTALLHAGVADDAEATLREGLRVFGEVGDDVFVARATQCLALCALARDDVAAAERLARDALSGAAQHGERQGIAEGLLALAAVAGARSQPERAATLAGAASAVRETIAARPATFDIAIPERLLQRAEQALSADRWRRSWDAGHALAAEAAIGYALS